jgi:hypothetical protein
MEFGPFKTELKRMGNIDVYALDSITLENPKITQSNNELIDEHGQEYVDTMGLLSDAKIEPSGERSMNGARLTIHWVMSVVAKSWGIDTIEFHVTKVVGEMQVEEFGDNESDRNDLDIELIEYEVDINTEDWTHIIGPEDIKIGNIIEPQRIELDFSRKKCEIQF